MAAIYPIPTARVSDLLKETRLLTQLTNDKQELLRLQDQLSTGRRLQLPSDDAPAAVRAMVLQRVLEEKGQIRANLRTGQTFLGASENALSHVSDLITSLRGDALATMNSTVSDAQRAAVAEQVRQAIDQIKNIANQQVQGRYLFAGTQTNVVPFSSVGPYLSYQGNEQELATYADLGVLFDSSISAQDVFGAFSPGITGRIDLNPVLRPEMRLTDLRAGQGISLGTIRISDGSQERVVDLSGAETIQDVVERIEHQPPPGRHISVRLQQGSLVVQLDEEGGGNLLIREVGSGTTAAELGVFHDALTGTLPIVGSDLDPRLALTTPLRDLLGVRAAAALTSAGSNNDIAIEALQRGSEGNGYSFQVVEDQRLQAAPGIVAGHEFVTYSNTPVAARTALAFQGLNNNLLLTATAPGTGFNDVTIEVTNAGSIGNAALVSYDPFARRLTVGIDNSNQTQVQTIIDAVNAEGTFNAAYDPSDLSDGGFQPTATVPTTSVGAVSGFTGQSGGNSQTFFIHVAAGNSNASQVVSALQASPEFSARFTAVVDNKDSTGTPYEGQGVMDMNAAATTTGGSGGEPDLASGVVIENAGVSYTLSFAGVVTVEDLLNRFNGSPAQVRAEIDRSGRGLLLRSKLSGTDFFIGENGGTTATELGIRSLDRETTLAELNHGQGVQAGTGPALTVVRKDGTSLDIDLTSARTIGEVLDAINTHPDNLDPATRVTARLAAVGNGIELVDNNPLGTGTLTLQRRSGSTAAWDLGLIPLGQDQITGIVSGTAQVIRGADVNPQEVQGLFNSLRRMYDALAANDIEGTRRAMTLLDDDFERLNFARAELGTRQQSVDSLQQRLESDNIQLKSSLSDEIDVDLAETISGLSMRQASMQATLQMVGRTLQMTILDFL